MMHKRRLNLISLMAFSLLVGCSEEAKVITPIIEVTSSPLNFTIYADGELEAVKSTPITAPARSRRPQTLAWIVPQYTEVKAGEIVARFDGGSFQLAADESEYELQKLAFSEMAKAREIGMNLTDFNEESQVVQYEYQLAQQFNIDNPLLYTKIEIIDAADNETFLEAKTEHLNKKKENYGKKSETEMEVLSSSKQLQQSKLDLNKSSLSGLEVKAPHDGMVVLEASWDGALPQPGKSVFPGSKLASLPDLAEMKAKIYVPEVEAIGIRESQPVEIRLHAYANDVFTGTVNTISQTAQPRERDSPIKFFTIEVNIDQKDSTKLLPGQRLEAVINIGAKESGISIPIQSIFREGEASWVYKKQADGFIRQDVKSGLCSSTQCQIVEGLQASDQIALADPTTENKSNTTDEKKEQSS